MNKQLDRTFENVIFMSLNVMTFSIPTIFLPQIPTNFALPKLSFLVIGAAFLFGCWFSMLLLRNSIKIKNGPLLILMSLFTVFAMISFFTSVHKPTSLYGDYGRFEGIITFISYWALFFVASQMDWDKKRIRYFSAVLAVTAGIVAFFGFLQFTGVNVFGLKYEFSLERSSSTFGNPTVLAAYLVLIFPVIITLIVSSKSIFHKAALIVIGATVLSSILTSFSRGGWLSLLITVLFFSVVLWSKQISGRLLLVSSLLFMIIFATAIIVTAPVKSSDTNFQGRFLSIFKAKEGSFGSRIEIWRGAVRLIGDRPVFGSGPDTFGLVFPKYQSARLTALHGFEGFTDNAHNYFLQLAATVGLPAAINYFSGILYACWAGLILVKRWSSSNESEGLLFLGLILGLAAYSITSLLELTFLGTTFLVWIILGIINSYLSKGDILFGISLHLTPLWRTVMAVFLIFLILFVPTFQIYKLFAAEVNYGNGLKYQSSGDTEMAANYYWRAINANLSVNEYYQSLAWNFSERRQTGDGLTYARREHEALSLALTNNPFLTINYSRIAEVDIYLAGQTGDNFFYNEAGEMLATALKLEPNSARAYYTKGTLEYFQFKYKKAIVHLRRAITIDSQYAQAHYALGLAYQADGQGKKAESELKTASNLDSTYR